MSRLRPLFIALLFISGLAGCDVATKSADDASRGLQNVVTTRTLRAAYVNYPPSMSVDPNTKAKSGIMADVIEAASDSLGVKLDYVEETTFATMIDTLNSGRVDIVVSGIWPSSSRALHADFSRVVYYSPVYAYVRSGNVRFDNSIERANSRDVRIATVDGELSSIVARSDYPAASNVSLPQQTDVSQLLLQLSTGKADITFVEPAVADAFLAKNPGSIRRVSGVPPIRVFPNTFLFRKGDTGIRDAVNVAIVELTNSGRVNSLIKSYDHDGTHFVAPVPPVSP